jgi:hypothetical protein
MLTSSQTQGIKFPPERMTSGGLPTNTDGVYLWGGIAANQENYIVWASHD